MAKTTKRRRRKHRGTQSGRIDQRAARPKTRAQARAQVKKGRKASRDTPPTWRGAVLRAVFAAGIFVAMVALVFKEPISQSIGLGVLMLAFYIPMGYWFDNLMYKRRMRSKQEG